MADRRFRMLAWGTLGYGLLVILWGYFLRISESGDGCGTDWPLCHGEVVPSTSAFPTWVEFIHRISSGSVLILVLILAVLAFRRFPTGHPLRLSSAAALLFTVTESLFGAALVVFGWVAGDVSAARIAIRPLHVTNTFSLMASLALTAWWAHRNVRSRPVLRGPVARRWVPALAAFLLIAGTGSWTGLAGTAFPAASVSAGIGQYIDPEHLLIYLRVVHPVVAVLMVVGFARLVGRAFRSERAVERRFAAAIAGFAGVQVVLGTLTILLLHPVALRLLHLLAADLLWIALVLLAVERLAETEPRVRPEPPVPTTG